MRILVSRGLHQADSTRGGLRQLKAVVRREGYSNRRKIQVPFIVRRLPRV